MPDISSQQQSLNRRRQLAAALQQQSMLPLEQPGLPGANMNVTQGLARVAQALVAALSNRKLDKEQGALDTSQQAERAAAAEAYVPRGTGEYQVTPSPVGEPQTMERLAGPQEQGSRAAMVKALSSGTPDVREMTQAQLQNQIVDRRQNAGNAEQMARMLAGQQFDMKQLNAQQAQQERLQQQQQSFTSGENALNRTATSMNQSWNPGDFVRDGKGGYIQLGDPKTTLNLSNLSKDTVAFKTAPNQPIDVLQDLDPESKTKGRMFLQTEQGLKDITGQTVHWEKPTASALNNPMESENSVKYIADQVRDNPLNWNLTAGNRTLQRQVREELATGSDVNRLTAATRQLGETADSIVPKIDETIKKLDDPKFTANLGPIMGRWNEFLSGRVGTNDPDLAKMRATLALIQTGTMRAHVGARGSEGLLAKFEGLVDGKKMDAATLKGSLTGIRDFLEGYRERIHPEGTDQKDGNIPEYERGPDGKLRLKQ